LKITTGKKELKSSNKMMLLRLPKMPPKTKIHSPNKTTKNKLVLEENRSLKIVLNNRSKNKRNLSRIFGLSIRTDR